MQSSTRRRKGLFVTSLIILSAFLTACAGTAPTAPTPAPAAPAPAAPAPQQSEWDKIVEAAKKEGMVTVYGSGADSTIQGVKKAFELAYPGIKAEVSVVTSGPQKERVTQEIQANKLVADVLINTDSPWLRSLGSNLQNLDNLPVKAEIDAEWWNSTTPVVASFAQNVMYNSNNIKAGEIKVWADVLAPKYKGRIAILSPAGGTGNQTWWANLIDNQGKDFAVKLAAQNPVIVDTTTAGGQLIAAGEVDLLLLNVAYNTIPLQGRGAPVADMFLEPVAVVAFFGVALNGPHPNAAKLFLNFLMTADGQQGFCGDKKLTCVNKKVTTALPLPAKFVRYDPAVIAERRNDIVNFYNETFKK